MRGPFRYTGVAGTIALLLAGYVAVYLVTLGVRPLARMDEFRYAEVGREMLASGDWITPHLNGIRYFEKPAMGYWIQAASQFLFGQNAFASRLPSALATGLTALFIGLLAYRLSRDPRTGTLAAFIYLTFLAVFAIGTINILDPQLTLWLTIAIGSWFWAVEEPTAGARRRLLVVAGVAGGFAFLTKGFLAFVIPVIVIVPFLAWQRRWRNLLTDLWLPAVIAIAVALPWSLLIHRAEPDFWHYFFWQEHVRRFASDNAQHKKPFWLFLAVFPAMALPWASLVPAALKHLRNSVADQGVLRFLALWLLLPLLFFSVARGKLLTYILPCFAPLAILIALGLGGPRPGADDAALRNGIRALAGVWGLLLVVLLANRIGGIGTPLFGSHETARWFALCAAFALGLVACGFALRERHAGWRAVIPGLVILPLLVAVPFVIPNTVRASKMPGDVLRNISRNLPSDALVVSDGVFIHAVGWELKRDDIFMLSPGELEYGLAYPDDRSRLLDADHLQRLLDAARGRRAIFIACDVERAPMVAIALRKAGLNAAAEPVIHGEMVAWKILPAASRLPAGGSAPPSG